MSDVRTSVRALDKNIAAIERIADALERIVERLDALTASSIASTPSNDDELVSMDELCARLGTSKRWIQRHIRPSARASARGRAWYRLSDVEAQIALGPVVADRSSRKRPRDVPAVARNTANASSELEVLDVEQRLRKAISERKRTP